MNLSWVGSTYQEKQAGSQAAWVFFFSLVVVVLVLAAQYEKVLLPLSVLLCIPFGILGALVCIWLLGMANDIYFQIGLLTLVGLSVKNAILIVEFAMIARDRGASIREAALEGAQERLRPILMTSLAFILGGVPLILSQGAGAASRHSIGIGIVGGMSVATSVAIFFIPLFYATVQRFSEWIRAPGRCNPPA